MINESELLALLRDIESAHVERTVSVNNLDKFCQAVCAFANDFDRTGQPGYLIVGADDAGQPSGLVITDEILRNLAGIRVMGFANRFGMGVARARKALELNGNPPPRFSFDPGYVDVFLESAASSR